MFFIRYQIIKNKYFRAYFFHVCLFFFFINLFTIHHIPVSGAENQHRPFISAGIGVDYATGDFGTGYSTDFISIPLIIDLYPTDRLDFEISVPFVYQSNSNNLYRGYGKGYQYKNGLMSSRTINPKSGQDSHNARTADTASGNGFSVGNASQSGSDSVSGMGDIYVSAGYTIIQEGLVSPETRLTAMMKIPVTDSDEGLGSGSFDFAPGVTLGKWLGNWHFFAHERYVFHGSSDNYEPEDHFTHEAEAGYQFTDAFYGAVSVFGATGSFEESDAPLEGKIKISWNFIPEIRMEAYISGGFSDGSPDSGAGAAIFHDF